MKPASLMIAASLLLGSAQAWSQSCTFGAAPQTSTDFYVTVKSSPLIISAGSGVLANDKVCNLGTGQYVPAGSYAGVSASVSTPPTNGTLTFSTADGSFTYTPNVGFSGFDQFYYVLDDGNQGVPAVRGATIGTKLTSTPTLVTLRVPAPEVVPTLSGWGMIALAGMLAAAGGIYTRRRRSA